MGEAYRSKLVKVFTYTDDKKIINFIQEEYNYSKKIEVLNRSNESSTDTASTEFVMKEFVKKL